MGKEDAVSAITGADGSNLYSYSPLDVKALEETIQGEPCVYQKTLLLFKLRCRTTVVKNQAQNC